MKIKVLTLNIWEGGKLFEAIVAFVKKQKADILLLQEVTHGEGNNLAQFQKAYSELQFLLLYPYQSFAPAFIDVQEGVEILQGNAVFSRFPITSTKTIFYDIPFGKRFEKNSESFLKTPRNLQHIVLKLDEKILNVFNTQGIWGLDGRDNKRRLKMAETIVHEIKDHENVILAGDFNVCPGTETIAKIEKQLHNVFGSTLKSTFNMKQKENPGFAQAVVDMIFISSDIKAIDYSCLQVNISDHLPLICNLEL